MSTWAKEEATCDHEGAQRFYDYRDGLKIEWCGDCGGTISTEPDANQLEGQERRLDLESYFKLYANEQKKLTGTAMLSYAGWVQEGRPTFRERQEKLNTKPKGAEMTDTNTNATGTATATTETPKEKAPRAKGAKQLIRDLFTNEPNLSLTVDEIAEKIGKPKGSITTAISDLKSTKYAGEGGVLKLYRSKDGHFSLTQPVESAAAPASTEGAAPQTAVTDAPVAQETVQAEQGEALPA